MVRTVYREICWGSATRMNQGQVEPFSLAKRREVVVRTEYHDIASGNPIFMARAMEQLQKFPQSIDRRKKSWYARCTARFVVVRTVYHDVASGSPIFMARTM